jgi:mannobiose 2-epimerase
MCAMHRRVVAATAVLFALSISGSVSTAPRARTAVADARADLQALAPAIRRNLEEAVIRFWYPQSIDREHGGYVLAFDESGTRTGSPPKMIVTQARMVWLFARLARSGYRRAEMLDAAAQGYRFLADRMWDRDHGGFYWEVDPAGTTATDPDKYLYGQSFGLYALSEYARASGDRSALDLATRTFDLIVQHGRDPQFGGYYEFRRRDWSAPPPDRASHVGGPAGAKLMNTHLHLLEAVAEYYRAGHSPAARERLTELVTIQSNAVVRKELTACTDQYERDWTPILAGDAARVSYGHDLENVWLLADAMQTLGEANAPLVDLYRRLFAYSEKYGFDDVNGGFLSSGPFDARADQRQKIWWVEAEALVSALTMFELTGEPRYADVFARTWKWIDEHQTDRAHGEWFQEVLPDGRTRGVKADAWKAGYHNGRALIECLERLEALGRGTPRR